MGVSVSALQNSAVAASGQRVDPAWRGIYRVGGLGMALAGVCYLIGSTLGSYLGVPPAASAAFLQSLAAHPAVAQTAYWLFILADVCFIPAILGLYLSLKDLNRSAMLLAAALLGFFFLLDFGVTESNTLALIALTQQAAQASGAVERAAFLAGANWGLATIPLATFFSWVGPSSGFLIAAIVMRRSSFGRYVAMLGMLANGLGILAGFYFLFPVPVVSILLTPILVIYGIWLIASGRRLFALGN